ncbi:MAG: carboxypeptidase-like regulatory domain-containing protein [Gammaproteobacteria bacterium]|nr:carboxypeptidase-like regulatory domain-containing protein [Gammaproteobacteria bacterium]
MVHKLVFHFCLPLLSLCLITGSARAEESILLIDNARGIDNTLPPTAEHLNELGDINESLKDILSDGEIEPDTISPDESTTSMENPEQDIPQNTATELEPEKIIDPINVGIETRVLLIDNTLGIDNTDKLIIPQVDELAEPEKSIPPAKLTEQTEVVDVVTPDANIIPVEEIPATVLPIAEPPTKTSLEITPAEKVEPLLPIETKAIVTPAVALPPEKSAIPQKQADNSAWIPKDSDLRILEIRIESYTFDDVIGAYQHKDIIMLPLGALASLLDIAITVTPNFASGFIIKEDNTFSLDTDRNEVILKGIPGTYKSELVKNLDGDIYVESNLLGVWLNMKLDIDLYASRVWVKSELKLPFLARIEREKRIEKALSRLNKADQQYPKHHEAYKDYTLPFVDQTLQLGQRFSDTGNVTTFNSTTYATADLMQHESTWYLTANDQDGIDDFRVTFGRTDPDGELLGFMNAREYQFGHVAEPRIGLINLPGQLKAGVTASNFPIGMQTEYDRHRFIGELLPGWEVELYQNNALIGYQQTAINGQYDFQDVPLLFGNNHFRLVFYGPKGEIKEEDKNFQLSQSMTKQGEHYYRASAITDDIGSQRTTVQYDYGISKNLSSTFNLVSIPIQEVTAVVQHNYLGASLTGYWDALLASATIISDSESGSATEINLQSRIDEITIGFNDIYLSNFFSEEYLPTAEPIKRSSKLDLSTAIPASFLPRIPVSFGFKRDQYTNGGELFEITNQLSMSTHGFAMTNNLTHQKVTGQQATANGNFQLSTNIEHIRLRGTIGYELQPDKELTNLALTLDPGQYGDYRLSFGINHSLQQDITEYSATANKLSGKYSLSFGARYNTNNEINLDVSFSVGFGYEPRRNRWQQDSRTLANQGSVSARFFLDANQDGIFDDNEEALGDIGVRLNGGYNKGRSDEEGILFLTGITAHNSTNVVIAPETLTDPLWTVALEGIQVVPRPGHAIQVDFPIFTTGEIDGTVSLLKDGRTNGVGRVIVELVDQKNRVVATTETAYDGFYILSKIPLGEYHVRVSEKQLSTLGLRPLSEETVTVKADDPYVNGIDFTLEAIKSN